MSNALILTGIRSGSTYLCRLLSPEFGYPGLHCTAESLVKQANMREFFAPNRDCDPWARGKPARDEAMAHLRHRRDFFGEGRFLIKVLLEQYRFHGLHAGDRGFVEEMFPNPRYIWLERSDLLDRAVSAYFFFRSRVDHVWDRESRERYLSTDIDVDMKGLVDVYHNHVARTAEWAEFLTGTDYLRIEYDDLVNDPAGCLARCWDYLGITGDVGERVASVPRFRTERPESVTWKEKLRSEIGRKLL